MPGPFTPILRPLGLDPSQGYDTAAAGARDAQKQANALSDLQWQRQMQGLGQAQGYTNQLQSLYNSLYSPGGGQAAAGGMQSLQAGPNPGASMLLSQQPQTQPQGGTPGLGSLASLSPAYQYWTKLEQPALKWSADALSGGATKGLGALKNIVGL
jgi:hypothetical protein